MCLRLVGIDQRRFRVDLHGLLGLRHSEREVDGLLLPQAGEDIVGLLRLESLRFYSDRVCSRLELREVEAAFSVCPGATPQPCSWLLTVTVAPGTAAALESVTCPRIALVGFPLCPCGRGHEQNRSHGEESAAEPEAQKALGSQTHGVCPSQDFKGCRKAGEHPHPVIRIHYEMLTMVNRFREIMI